MQRLKNQFHMEYGTDIEGFLDMVYLNEPDKYPGAKDRKYERKNGSPPQGGIGQEQQRQQDTELCGGNGGPCGWRDKFVHAELLHDQARHAHADAGAEDCQKAGQAGDQEYLQMLPVPL